MIGNIGPVQLLIVLLIVLLIFGTKRIRSLGSDLGGAIKEFRKGMSEDGTSKEPSEHQDDNPSTETSDGSSKTTKH